MKNRQKLGFFGVITCVLIATYFVYNKPGINSEQVMSLFFTKYSGRIIKKGTHKGGMTFSIESDTFDYNVSVSNFEVFNIVQIGDSIFKEGNSFKVTVVRGEDSLFYNVISFRDFKLKEDISKNGYWDSVKVNTSMIKLKGRMYGLDWK